MATILAVAPNGGRRTKADHPAVPVTTEEIAREAVAWRDAGASLLHLHVRDGEQRHSLDVDLYAQAIAAVRRAVGDELVVQITTESVGLYRPEEQIAAVKALTPEAVSLALRELAPSEDDVAPFTDFLAWLARERIAPQIILYDRNDVDRLVAYAKRGVFDPARVSILYVLGRYVPPTIGRPEELLELRVPEEALFRDWMLCAFGPREIECVLLAALLGGHIRVGFENNLALPGGARAPSNAAIVEATAAAVRAVGLPLATAAEVRERWPA
jgi:3-keto-5-aminohexanoate cleavage enzyme